MVCITSCFLLELSTYDGLFEAAVHWKDVFVNELHQSGPLGDFIVQIVG